jgi:hypothetical protein
MYFYSFVGSRAFIEIKYNLHASSSIITSIYTKIIARKTVLYIQIKEITHSLKYLYSSKMYAPLMARILILHFLSG